MGTFGQYRFQAVRAYLSYPVQGRRKVEASEMGSKRHLPYYVNLTALLQVEDWFSSILTMGNCHSIAKEIMLWLEKFIMVPRLPEFDSYLIYQN